MGDKSLSVANDSYWTTNDSGELTRVNDATDDSNDWNVKYDPSTATLTLKNATIIGVPDNVNTVGVGIYAASSSDPVSLNIVLEGENKVSGGYGINVSSGGAASLSISGSGSLTVSATATNGIGIFVQAQSGDANLAINGANVNAVVTENNGRGVELRTGQDGNPNLTIEVKGGSLQASGQPNGIIFFTNKNNTYANANLKVSGNAMVKTSGITTEADGTGSAPELKPAASGSDGTGGIIWDGKSGTVYGDVTLQEDITIGEGESLTIGDGASLDAGNHNVIVDGGTLDEKLKESLGDKVKYAPAITTTSLSDGEVGTAYSQKLEATGDPTITWSVTSGLLPDGLNLSEDGKITGTPTIEGESTFTVTATNDSGSDSKDFTLKIDKPAFIPVTGLELNKSTLTLQEKGSYALTAIAKPDDATNKDVTWKSSDTSIATVSENGTVTAISAGTATITVTAQDGSGVSTSCSVTVTHSMVHTPKKDATCTEDGNIEYWYCKNCDKYFSDENATEGLSDVVIPATGHHYVNGYCTKCGHRDPDYRPDPISYYNIYVEDVCDGVEVSTSKQVVREGGSITVSVEKDTANYTFDNFKVYYKRSYYGGWEELKEGTQPGEYPIKNIWTHIYIKAEGAEEKEDPTGIESIEGVKVYTKDGSLYVQTPQREQVIIVSNTTVCNLASTSSG